MDLTNEPVDVLKIYPCRKSFRNCECFCWLDHYTLRLPCGSVFDVPLCSAHKVHLSATGSVDTLCQDNTQLSAQSTEERERERVCM